MSTAQSHEDQVVRVPWPGRERTRGRWVTARLPHPVRGIDPVCLRLLERRPVHRALGPGAGPRVKRHWSLQGGSACCSHVPAHGAPSSCVLKMFRREEGRGRGMDVGERCPRCVLHAPAGREPTARACLCPDPNGTAAPACGQCASRQPRSGHWRTVQPWTSTSPACSAGSAACLEGRVHEVCVTQRTTLGAWKPAFGQTGFDFLFYLIFN